MAETETNQTALDKFKAALKITDELSWEDNGVENKLRKKLDEPKPNKALIAQSYKQALKTELRQARKLFEQAVENEKEDEEKQKLLFIWQQFFQDKTTSLIQLMVNGLFNVNQSIKMKTNSRVLKNNESRQLKDKLHKEDKQKKLMDYFKLLNALKANQNFNEFVHHLLARLSDVLNVSIQRLEILTQYLENRKTMSEQRNSTNPRTDLEQKIAAYEKSSGVRNLNQKTRQARTRRRLENAFGFFMTSLVIGGLLTYGIAPLLVTVHVALATTIALTGTVLAGVSGGVLAFLGLIVGAVMTVRIIRQRFRAWYANKVTENLDEKQQKMANDPVNYIKLSRFDENSISVFEKELTELINTAMRIGQDIEKGDLSQCVKHLNLKVDRLYSKADFFANSLYTSKWCQDKRLEDFARKFDVSDFAVGSKILFRPIIDKLVFAQRKVLCLEADLALTDSQRNQLKQNYLLRQTSRAQRVLKFGQWMRKGCPEVQERFIAGQGDNSSVGFGFAKFFLYVIGGIFIGLAVLFAKIHVHRKLRGTKDHELDHPQDTTTSKLMTQAALGPAGAQPALASGATSVAAYNPNPPSASGAAPVSDNPNPNPNPNPPSAPGAASASSYSP